MANCLVTTLKNSVADEKLLKLGETRLHFTNTNLLPIQISGGDDITSTIEGDRYWTDATGSQNYGKIKFGHGSFYVSPGGEFDLRVSSKYAVKGFVAEGCGIEADLSDFAYFTLLEHLNLYNSPFLSGNIDDFFATNPQTFKTFSVCYSSMVTGDISCFSKHKDTMTNIIASESYGIKGNLSVFSNFTELKYLRVGGTNVEGNVSSLPPTNNISYLIINNTKIKGALSTIAAKCPNLVALNVSDTDIQGDTSDLASLTKFTTFYYANCPNITGNWPLT